MIDGILEGSSDGSINGKCVGIIDGFRGTLCSSGVDCFFMTMLQLFLFFFLLAVIQARVFHLFAWLPTVATIFIFKRLMLLFLLCYIADLAKQVLRPRKLLIQPFLRHVSCHFPFLCQISFHLFQGGMFWDFIVSADGVRGPGVLRKQKVGVSLLCAQDKTA